MTRIRLTLLPLLLIAAGTLFPRPLAAQSQYVRTLEDRDHVTIMEFGGVYDRQPDANRAYEDQVRQAITREFLRTHTDDYDFVVAFTRFNYSLGTDSEGGTVGGRYYGIKNDVSGIGLEPFDLTAQWGSGSGALQGFIDMGVLSRLATDPTDPKFEQTLSILAHEFQHRWGSHVRFRAADGSTSSDLIGRENSHWNFLLNTHNSVHYGQEWRDNGDGTFTSTGRAMTFYSPLDLYLMGLLDKSQVPPFFLIRNSNIPASRLPEVGVTITGTKQVVTIEDVIAAEGERLPSAADAKKRFKIGFVFLVRPGEQADGLELAQINAIRDAFSTRMLILTGGKGLVQVYPDQPPTPGESPTPIPPPSSGPRSGPADLAQALDWILSRQAVDGSFADSVSTRVRDTSAVLDLLRESPSAFTEYQRGLAWLSQLQEQLNVDMVSRRLLAIQPQFSATDSAFLADARNASGGWGLRKGYQSDPLDTALALAAAPTPGSAVDLAYLLGTQNADGGWGLRPGSASSIQGTLAALRLRERYPDATTAAAMQHAVEWLIARQNPDGGFGQGGSTIFETADAVLYLLHTSFPKPQIASALEYLRGQQLADGSWNESAYQTALALRALKVAELPNAAITGNNITTSVANPIDGQQVNVRAVIVNDSVRDVQDLTVSLFDGDPAQGGTQIGADIVIANLPALSQLPVTFSWDTTGKAGAHQLIVILDRAGQVDEFNEADNRASTGVTVRQPPVEPDLTVTQSDITFMPSLLQAIPQDETLTAVITNGGQTAVSNVVVSVFDDDPSLGRKVGEATINVPGRGKATATVTFQVTTAGDHRYFVVVDANNQVAEADETNNAAFATLVVQSTHDFVIDPSLTVSENPTGLGRDLTVTATVRNQGTTDAFAVPVRLVIEDPAGAIDIASQVVDLAAGGSKTISAVWRTSRALNAVPLAAIVDPANAYPESSESNNRVAIPLTVSSSSQPNLHVAPGSLQTSGPVNEGSSTTITLPVGNNGAAAVSNVTVAFYLGLPGNGGVQIGTTQVIPAIAPGAQATASVSWSPTGHGEKLLFAVVDAANAIDEFDEADNSAFVTVAVRSLPDFAVSAAAISFTPAFPKQGDPVVVAAILSNLGEQAAPARIRFFDGDPSQGGVLIGQEQTVASIPGLGQAVVQVSVPGGGASVRAIHVQVDPLNEVIELDETNNAASRVLGVQDSSFFVSNLYFSPNGDDRQDITELFFRFDQPQALKAVTIYNAQHRVVQRLTLNITAAESSAIWDGRDDKGRVVPDGAYDMAVTSAGGVDLGSARVVVDTNNLPVSAALGSKFLLDSNLTCSQTYDAGDGYFQSFVKLGWLPDDSGLVQMYQTSSIVRGGKLAYTEHEVGIYVTTPDGETTTRITPDEWTIHPPAGDGTYIGHARLSKDGRKVVIATQKYHGSTSSREEFFGPVEFWSVNTDGSGFRKIAQTPADAYLDPPAYYQVSMAVSPDGERLAYTTRRLSGFSIVESRIYVAQTDGSGQAMVQSIDERTNSLSDVTWSPDGSRLVYSVLEPFEPTSYIYTLYSTRPDGTDKVVAGRSVTDLDALNAEEDDDWTITWLGSTKLAFKTSAQLTGSGYFEWGGSEQVYLLSLDGSAPQRLSTGGGEIASAVRAPQGSAIAFTERLGPYDGGVPIPHRVWVANGDGESRAVYTSGEASLSVERLSLTNDGNHVSWLETLVTAEHTCHSNETGDFPCPDTILAIGAASVLEGSVSLVEVPDTAGTWNNGGSIQPIGLFPDGKSYLFANNNDDLVAISVADGSAHVLGHDANAQWFNGTFSPSGKYFLYRSQRDALLQTSACWKGMQGGIDEFAMTSLLNLTAQFGFTRDRSQLSIRGTAQDANFSRYTLEYAPAADAGNWQPIGPASDVAVVNSVLSEWVPPAAGSYYVRLTAEDKAGNVVSTRHRITWGVAPTITNVSIEPRVFSPNGDGTRDTATVEYSVLGPVNLNFEIYNAANAVVRTIPQSHTQIGPASIAWDGRDNSGQFVPGGTYRVHVLDYDFFVNVDTTAPALNLSIGSGFHTVPQKVICVDPARNAGCIVIPGPLVETPYFDLVGSVNDDQIAQWRLEIGTGTNPTDWQFVADGSTNRAASPALARLTQLDRVVNRRYRLTASDQAGNRASVVSDFAPQEVVLYGYDNEPVNTGRPVEQRLGQHTLSLAYTGRTPALAMTVQYRLQGTPVWGNGPSAPAPQGSDLPWDNSTLSVGKIYEVRVLVTDVNGSQYASNVIQIRSNVFLMMQYLPELSAVPGIISLNDTIKSLTLVRVDDDGDITGGSSYSGAVEFLIGVKPDPAIPQCSSRQVNARFKAVGLSGKVYYSNNQVVTQGPPPSMVSCPGDLGFGGSMELKITTAEAIACGQPTPGQTTITLLGDDVVDPKLYVQLVPNGPLQLMNGLTLQLNTLTMPEGIYNVRATGKLPQPGQPEISKVGTFVVDRSAPASQITYPATNQPFCSTRQNGRSVVHVEGIAEDPNFAKHIVEFGFGDNPQNWVPLPAQVPDGPRRGVVGDWEVTGLPSGTYSLRQRVYDKGGNLACSVVSFFLAGPVRIENAQADLRLISPNGDGLKDATLVSYQLRDAATVTARVYAVVNGQRSATPVRTLFLNTPQLSGVNSFVWDGFADGGAAVADGTYAVVVSGGDSCGTSAEGVVEIVVDNTKPDALILAPQAGNPVAVVTDVRGTTTDAHFQTYRLEVGETDAPVNWTVLATGSAPVQNALLGKWTRSAAEGVYTLRLTATDAASNTRVTLVTVTTASATALISTLTAQPTVFSPNLDGRLDDTSVEYRTRADARVRLEVLDNDVVIRTLSESDALASSGYTFGWDGKNASGVDVPEGSYVVRLSATAKADASQTQVERTTVVVDRTAPVVATVLPLDGGFVHGSLAVTGTASDAHLASYVMSYTSAATGAVTPIDEGAQSRTDHVFGTLNDLADGRYTLTMTAKDVAENSATRTVTFSVDNTAPQVTLTSPAANAVVGGQQQTVDVRGTIQDVNLQNWTLRVGPGSEPQAWTTVATGTSTVLSPASLGTWNGAGAADGLYTLSLVATDKAGQVSDTRVAVSVDRTLPTAQIAQPTNLARISKGLEITGTATDAHFKSAVLDLSPGSPASASHFSPLVELTQPVTNGTLFGWQALPPDGVYTLRLRVEDELGQRSETRIQVTVDTEPPRPATNLTATVESKKNVRLAWTASPDSDVVGYHVYREGNKLTTTPVAGATYLDQNLTEGRYRYVVKAVDSTNLESAASNEVTVPINLTPPATRIQSPASASTVSGIVEIRGTAAATDDFKEYRLSVGTGAAPASFTLVRRSPAAVTGGLLGEYDTAGRAEGSVITFKLEAEDLDGNVGVDQVTVTIDNVAPATPVLVSANAAGADATIQWRAGGTDTDIAGYLLYNNDLLANVRRIVSGSTTPYLLAGTSFVDKALPDGVHKYYVVAVDRAGNVSASSNTITVVTETRAPRATITQPGNNVRTEHSVQLVATTTDEDVARVQFQIKVPGSAVWTNLSSPIETAPYQLTWDPAGLAFGDYQFRAVATDTHNNTDAAPPAITVMLRDLTPPPAPTALTVLVNGNTTTLAWPAVSATDLDGYAIYRQIGSSSPVRVNPSLVTTTSFVATGLADGTYVYTVRAIDKSANESPSSPEAAALVYTPVILAPAACVAGDTTPLTGFNAAPHASVSLLISGANGMVVAATTMAGADGVFAFDHAPLANGVNTFSVEATDTAGNISRRPIPLVITRSDLPAAPTHFTAVGSGATVTLTWDADPSVTGYMLTRNDTVITAAQNVAATGTASSSSRESSSFAPSRATDGKLTTSWMPLSFDPAPWWQVTFPAPILVDRLEVEWSPEVTASGFLVQRFDGTNWITIQRFQENTERLNAISFSTPISTARIRLAEITSDEGTPQLAEVRVFKRNLIAGGTYVDSTVADGRYTYTLSAVNACGIEGPAAEATVEIGDVIAPAAPSGLAASVSESRVSLTWTPVSDSDVAGYNVYRRGTGDWTRVNNAVVPSPSFEDPAVANGSYLYRVTAVDAKGNESAPSNEAAAVVNVPPPPAPSSLTVTVVSEGGALDLAWQPPTGNVAGYHVLRAQTPGGPYTAVTGTVTAASYRDTGLADGTPYFYVVVAVDPAGNESAPSNEASGTPDDHSAPAAPLLLYPTDATHPRTLTSATTVISGVAEPGSAVTLLQDGLTVAETTATSAVTVESLAIPGVNIASDFLASESLLALFNRAPDSNDNVLTVVDTMSGTTRSYPEAKDGSTPSFSPAGDRIAFINRASTISVLDRVTGQVTDYLRPHAVSSPVFGPGGNVLAYVGGISPSMTLWAFELSTGDARPLATAPYLVEPVWSPTGATLAFTEYVASAGTYTLKVVDVTSATVTTVDVASSGEPVSFSPDGTRLVYTSEASGHDEVRIYTLASHTGVPMVADGGTRRGPAFSPDGQFVAYVGAGAAGTEVRVRDLGADADVLVSLNPRQERPVWTLDRSLMLIGFEDVRRVRPAGAFRFAAVPLPFEQNVFSAMATDAGGNVSSPAAPITLLHDRMTLPDLTVGDAGVVLYPRFPVHGEPVRISATVRNDGEVAAANIGVGFYVRGADGRLTSLGLKSIASLAAHQQAIVSLDWDTGSRVGGQDVFVQADPANVIVETSESNNEGAGHLVITADGAPTVSVSVNHATYPSTDSVVIDAEAANPGAPADFSLELRIEDEAGFLVTSVVTEPLPAFGYTSKRVQALWPAAGVFAGKYRVRAVLRRTTGAELSSTAAFSIVADRQVQTSVVTDRADYQVGDVVQLSSTIRNAGANAELGPVSVHLRIVDGDGLQVFVADREVALLLPGAQAQIASQWVATRPGAFTAEIAVLQDGQELATAHSDFAVSGVAKFRGQLSVSPSPVAAKGTFTISAEASNTGSLAAQGGTLKLQVIDVERQQMVRQLDRVVDLLPGATVPWQVSMSSTGLDLKSYNVLLQLDADGLVQTLASSTVTIVDRQAPTVTIASPANGFVTNADVVIDAVVTDDGSGVARAEVQVDGGDWMTMAAQDVVAGRFRASIPAAAMSDGSHTFVVRAFDRAGNGEGTASDDPNPVSGTFVVDRTPPTVTVTGVEEGVTYHTAVQPIIVASDAVSVTALLNAQPYQSGTPVAQDGVFTLSVIATDAAGNVAMTEVHFTLELTAAPEALDQAVTTAEDQARAITLTGSGGSGPLTFTVVSTPQHGELTGTAPNLTYTPAADFSGADSFTFVATDGVRTSAIATVAITVTPVNDAPIANAGADVNVTTGQAVTLDATGSRDPEGSVITYLWQVTAVPSGSGVTTASLSDPRSPRPSFTPDVAGNYTLEVVVSDGSLSSVADSVTVHAEAPASVPPNANAGPDQQVLVGTMVAVNGSTSNDPDHGPQPLTYHWHFTAVPSESLLTDSNLSNPTGVAATFTPDVPGDYVLALTVSDGAAESTDTVRIVAAANTLPVASAGADQTITLGSVAQLDGSASADADGGPEPLHYTWAVVSRPTGSSVTNASITGATSARASFVPDRGGVYVLSVTVSDGAATSTDNVAVTVQSTQHASGSAYLMRAGFQEKLSLDVIAQNGAIENASWLKYLNVKSRLDLASTAIRSFTVDGNTATIAGDAKVNNASGFQFVATVTDGSPDAFSISITRPDGTLLYQYGGNVEGGDLALSVN